MTSTLVGSVFDFTSAPETGRSFPAFQDGAKSATRDPGLSARRGIVYSFELRPSMSAPAAIGKPETHEGLDAERAEQNSALVQLAHENPEAGLTELHRRFAGTVNRLVWRLLGPDSDHDDLVQQVFFAMLTSIRQLRDPSKLDVWVRTVTVNAVRQELRRRSVRRLFWGEQKHVRRSGDLVSEVESRDLLGHCTEILDKIPTAQRLVFVLHFVEGHSLKEVAAMCGYSHITAKRRLKAANKRFRSLIQHRPDLLERLAPEGPDDDE